MEETVLIIFERDIRRDYPVKLYTVARQIYRAPNSWLFAWISDKRIIILQFYFIIPLTKVLDICNYNYVIQYYE